MHTARFQLLLFFALLASTLVASACKPKSSFDEMSDEEKVNYEIDIGESLTPEELEAQKAVRKKILNDSADAKRAAAELESAMKEARDALPETALASLEAAQSKWLTSGRGSDINALIGAGKTIQEANAQALLSRADKIREQTSRAILVDAPGRFQGYYRTSLGQSLEIYEIDGTAHVTLRLTEPALVVTARGKFKPDSPDAVTVSNDAEPDVSFVMTRVQDGAIEVVPTDRFKFSTMKQFAEPLLARYTRVKEGELDVFSF